MPSVADWLSSVGSRRRNACEEAASLITSNYRQKWSNLKPVELNRLAASLNVQLRELPELEGGARLAPTPGGFLLLFSEDSRQNDYAQFRISVSHELAHTLFFERKGSEGIPQRLLNPSEEEERFCFEVARRILAPRWILSNLGLLRERDASVIFKALTKTLGLSWSVAARLMVEDYPLVLAVAGRWRKIRNRWQVVSGEFFSTPELPEETLLGLTRAVGAWLERESTVGFNCNIAARFSNGRRSAFVIAQIPSAPPQELTQTDAFWQANLKRWPNNTQANSDRPLELAAERDRVGSR